MGDTVKDAKKLGISRKNSENGKIIFSSRKDEVLENYVLVKGGNELLNA